MAYKRDVAYMVRGKKGMQHYSRSKTVRIHISDNTVPIWCAIPSERSKGREVAPREVRVWQGMHILEPG
jgi:hypothetical protein